MAERRPTDGSSETGGWFQRIPWVLVGVLEVGGWLVATQFSDVAQPWQASGYVLGSALILIGAAAFCVHVAWRMRRGDPRLIMVAACLVVTVALMGDAYERYVGDTPFDAEAAPTGRSAPLATTPPTSEMASPASRLRGNREDVVKSRNGQSDRLAAFAPSPGAIYQGNAQVGDFQGDVEVDEPGASVKFKTVRFSMLPDPAQPLRYDNVLMTCEVMPRGTPPGTRLTTPATEGAPCRIVGHVTP
jgi:hypothetical protein